MCFELGNWGVMITVITLRYQLAGLLAHLSLITFVRGNVPKPLQVLTTAEPAVGKSWHLELVAGQRSRGVLPCSLIYACLMSWQCVF